MLSNRLALLCLSVLFPTLAYGGACGGNKGSMTIDEALRTESKFLYAEGSGYPLRHPDSFKTDAERKEYKRTLNPAQQRMFLGSNKRQFIRMAKRAAKVVATSNLVQKLNLISNKAREIAENNQLASHVITVSFSAQERGIQTFDAVYSEEHEEALATACIPIYGKRGIISRFADLFSADNSIYLENQFNPSDKIDSNADSSFDGLIVNLGTFSDRFDARIHEQVRTKENGIIQVVYSTHNVPEDVKVARGMVKYTNSLTKAKGIMDVSLEGKKPLVAEVIDLSDGYPVISIEDATKVYQANAVNQFLVKARVVVIVIE